MSETAKKQLKQQLWNIANELRGKMNADEFRVYILGFIFYKYLSEKMEVYANELLEADNIKYVDLQDNETIEYVMSEAVKNIGFALNSDELFSNVSTKGQGNEFILDDLPKIFKNIEQSTLGTASQDDFDGLFYDVDLTDKKLGNTAQQRNDLIAKILVHLDKIEFNIEDNENDILGDAYEYLIGQFASGAGKKAGEFYTPQEVSIVLAKIVTMGKNKLKSVYDPTCGSGSLLLRVAKEVTEVGDFYGQELNRTTYNLARMNMIMHDVNYSQFDIKQEDTLEEPQHLDKRFEAIVANPPFSQKWEANDLKLTDNRFSQYGKLAPKTKADFAFIQHMIYQLDENGVMAVVVPHGTLFRGASEGIIRQYLIKNRNYLDAVIGLPANIFYGTSIPTAILVFKKCRENADDVFFIDASQEFGKATNQSYLRDEDISKIITTLKERKNIDKFSYVAKLTEIEENGYNLNIPRYVDTFEEEALIDLAKVSEKLKAVDIEITDINSDIAMVCDELGIVKPF
ncbi:MAG TPA: type I restriction-modification system subunit M [Arcobacter sp.]|nr:type I restriction-modification system subunit M [Arcobacter sp.]